MRAFFIFSVWLTSLSATPTFLWGLSSGSLGDTTGNLLSEKGRSSSSVIRSLEDIPVSTIRYALLLDVAPEEITNDELSGFVCSWIGTPYVHGGNTKKGLDCSAFSRTLISEIYGVSLSRTVAPQFEACEPIEKDSMKEGDLVFFETYRPGLSHVGVYLGNHRFVHASSSRGVVVDDLRKNYYVKAYRRSGRIRTTHSKPTSGL